MAARPAAGSLGPATATIRLGARVIAIAGADALIETSARPGAAARRAGTATWCGPGRGAAARRSRAGAHRPCRRGRRAATRASPASTPAARAVDAGCRDRARCRGARGQRAPGRPGWPDDHARLDRAPERAAARARVGLAPEQPGFALRRSRRPRQRPAAHERPGRPRHADQHWRRTGDRVGWRHYWPRLLRQVRRPRRPAVPAGPRSDPRASRRPGRAGSGTSRRWCCRATRSAAPCCAPPDSTLQVDTTLDLPAGARLRLSLPAGSARSGAALLQAGPLDAVRTLAAWLREQAEVAEPAHRGRLRLPEADATLATGCCA